MYGTETKIRRESAG